MSVIEKQFKKIRKGLSTFTSNYMAVKSLQTTGNLTEEDIISGAVTRYCSLDIYRAIRKDGVQDKSKGKEETRKAKLAHFKWVACWRVLHTSDKFSGAASTTEDLGVEEHHSSDEDGDSGSKGNPRTPNKGYQRRPCGIKAADLIKTEDASTEKEVRASTAAVANLMEAQQEHTAICVFESPAIRNTPEAAKYRQAVLRQMMLSAGLAATPAPDAAPEPATDIDAGDINVVELDDGELRRG